MRNIEKHIKLICWFVIISFSGCVSTRIDYIEPDKLEKQSVYRIAVIYMKDGTIHNMQGIESKLQLNYKDIGNVITYKTDSGETKIIKLSEIDHLKIEVIENDIGPTILIITGSIILVTFLLILILQPFGNINASG